MNVFDCKTPNEFNKTVQIHYSHVCANDGYQCVHDESDEADSQCIAIKPGPMHTIIGLVISYIVLGGICYFCEFLGDSLFVFWVPSWSYLGMISTIFPLSVVAYFLHEEKSEDASGVRKLAKAFEPGKRRTGISDEYWFNSDLASMLLRLNSSSKLLNLNLDDKGKILKIYAQHHDKRLLAGEPISIDVFFGHVKNFSEVKIFNFWVRSQVRNEILDLAYIWEDEHHDTEHKAFGCIFENVQDLELKNWIFQNHKSERGFFYQVMEHYKSLTDSETWDWIKWSLAVLMSSFGFVWFAYDAIKDFLLYLFIDYVATEILVSM